MTLNNATGAALAVAERNGRMVIEIICSRNVIDVAVNALGECENAEQAHRLLSKACSDVAARLKGAIDA